MLLCTSHDYTSSLLHNASEINTLTLQASLKLPPDLCLVSSDRIITKLPFNFIIRIIHHEPLFFWYFHSIWNGCIQLNADFSKS